MTHMSVFIHDTKGTFYCLLNHIGAINHNAAPI